MEREQKIRLAACYREKKARDSRLDPKSYCLTAFSWGEGDLKSEGPRKWQLDVLETISAHLNNPEVKYQPLRIAVASGHGIGKSALIGQISNWAMSNFRDCKIVMTANTQRQLQTKTMPEVSKWFRKSIHREDFTINATSIHSKDKERAESWRLDAIPWSENNTEAFAGLHNQGKIIVLIFDEGSAISDIVWDVAEGALTDENTIVIWLVFGNPTRNVGRFKDCFGKLKHRWKTWQIDSRTVEGTNKILIDQWVKDYGENSDFVKVRVRGLFPSASFKQFISLEDVDAAFGRDMKENQYSFAPKILTVDPAWEGDDELVIGLRQGLHFKILRTIPKNDNDIQIANLVMSLEDEEGADVVFIDGGFGTGIISAGKTFGRKWQIVWFGEKSNDEGCLNKRSEMWMLMRNWLKEGGSIPKDPVLHQDLITPEAVPRLDGKLQLESKKDIKGRNLPSPNRADALALSFAHPITKKKPDKRQFSTSGAGDTGWMSG